MNPSSIAFAPAILIPQSAAAVVQFPCSPDQYGPGEGNRMVTFSFETGAVNVSASTGVIFLMDLTPNFQANQIKSVRSVSADLIVIGATNATQNYIDFQPIADLLLLGEPVAAGAPCETRSGMREVISSASGFTAAFKCFGLASGSGWNNAIVQLSFANFKRTGFPA